MSWSFKVSPVRFCSLFLCHSTSVTPSDVRSRLPWDNEADRRASRALVAPKGQRPPRLVRQSQTAGMELANRKVSFPTRHEDGGYKPRDGCWVTITQTRHPTTTTTTTSLCSVATAFPRRCCGRLLALTQDPTSTAYLVHGSYPTVDRSTRGYHERPGELVHLVLSKTEKGQRF